MQSLLDGLENHFLLQAEQRADAGRGGGAKMGDMVHLMFMQANRAHQINMQFITGRQATDKIAPGFPHGLRHRQHGRDIIAGVGVIGGEKRVVHIQFTDGGAIRPGRPFRGNRGGRFHAKHLRATCLLRMAKRHAARRDHRAAIDGGDGDRGIVDDPVDDHLLYGLFDRDLVHGDSGHFPGQLVFALQ